MLDEVWRSLCAVAILTVSVVTHNYAAAEFKDYRDGRVYRAYPSGNLNWFKQSLRYGKTSYFTDENGVPFYRDDTWEASCPEGTQVPDEMDWDQLIEDQFSGDDKLENMKNFVGHSSLGFYKFEMDEVVFFLDLIDQDIVAVILKGTVANLDLLDVANVLPLG